MPTTLTNHAQGLVSDAEARELYHMCVPTNQPSDTQLTSGI